MFRLLFSLMFLGSVLISSNKIFYEGITVKEESLIGEKSGNTPDGDALLELYGTKGLLLPRLTTAERNALTGAAGLFIFNTTTSYIEFNDGSSWLKAGFQNPLTTEGDLLYYTTEAARLAAGVENQVLTINSGVPTWEDTQSTYVDPLTTDGDIAIRDTSTTRLGIGTEGQVLTVASTGLPAWEAGGGIGADAETVMALNDFTANSGFETGDITSWVLSGVAGVLASVQDTTVADGSYSLSFDAAADGDTFTSDAFTIPNKLKNNNVVFCLMYKGGDENIRFVVNDGTNDFVDETLSTQTDWKLHCANTVMPNVATITLRLEADADAAVIYADNFAFALAELVNISNVLDSVYSARIAANDTITSQAGDFITSVSSVATGIYVVTFTSSFFSVAPSVNATPETANTFASISSLSATGVTVTINDNGGIDTDSAFTLRVQKQGADYASNQVINPSTQMVASGVDLTLDATFTTTSASYVNVSGANTKTNFYGTAIDTTTTNDAGFKMPYLAANTLYLIKVNAEMSTLYASSTTTCIWQIYDGTNEIGIVAAAAPNGRSYPQGISAFIKYDSVQTDKEFILRSIRAGGGGNCNVGGRPIRIGIIPLTEGMNNPHILNNVVSSSSDGVRVSSADLNCDAGSAITAQDGSWISSIGNISSGVCAVTLTSGTFSSTPNCSCSKQGATLDENSRADATTTTNVNLYGIVSSTGLALTSFDCELICVGGK